MWKSIFHAIVMMIFCVAGNGLSVLCYAGYECLCGRFAMPTIIDELLCIICLLPMLVSVAIIAFSYRFSIVVPKSPSIFDMGRNIDDAIYVAGIVDGVGKIAATLCLPVMALSFLAVLRFMQGRAETLIFSVSYFLSKLFVALVFLVSLYYIGRIVFFTGKSLKRRFFSDEKEEDGVIRYAGI